MLEAINNPEDPAMGTRQVPFSKVIYIEQDDFREDPPKKFFRLAPGREVRLRYAYFITCREVVKDPGSGEVIELRCTYDPATRGGNAPDGRKVKATLHWVAAGSCIDGQVRLYDRLFSKSDPDEKVEGKTFLDFINPQSLEVLHGCKLEPGLAQASPDMPYQFERLGYFTVDSGDASPDHPHHMGQPVFNRTVTLRDTWARIEKAAQTKR
jgi:glutaminyl-tRNA synthetase